MSGKRISKDMYYLRIAGEVASRSTCIRRNYGAVIVKNDEIISTGYNGAARGLRNCCDSDACQREKYGVKKGERYELCVAIHAEDNAITSAGRSRCEGATLYVVGFEHGTKKYADPTPCMMCSRKIINAGITRVVGLYNGTVLDIDVKRHLELLENRMFNNAKINYSNSDEMKEQAFNEHKSNKSSVIEVLVKVPEALKEDVQNLYNSRDDIKKEVVDSCRRISEAFSEIIM